MTLRQLFRPNHINRPIQFVVEGTFVFAKFVRTTRNLMRNVIALFAAALCLFLSSCHRPVAYFQPMPRPSLARLPLEKPVTVVDTAASESGLSGDSSIADSPVHTSPVIASRRIQPVQMKRQQLEHRMSRMQSLLSAPATEATDRQPEPKPKKKLKLGNQIRQGLGMKLRPELNWWQRISWKIKASVLVILVAVVFAILNITILAVIFGILGAFLLITGLKRSFKVKRPWF